MTQNTLIEIDGWKLSCNDNAIFSEDFLYLIEFIKDKEVVWTRFDINQNMFIDSCPIQLSTKDKKRLSKLLVERPI